MRQGWIAASLALALLLPAPVWAAFLPAQPDQSVGEKTAPPAAQSIVAERDAGADARIARRIEGIFGAVPALADVSVSAREGVVTLDGKVPAAGDIDRAEQIASRIEGVVTVENRVERDVSVGQGFGAIGGVSARLSAFLKLLPLIGVAILVAIAFGLAGYVLASLGAIWRRFTPNQFLADLIASAVRFVFVIGGIVIALDMIGAGALLGAVLGGAGIIGIALGFAMRDTIENYVASILLSVRQPFRPNDWVVIDSYEGRVIRLTSRATILMTLDGNHLRVPNSMVFKAVILNYSRNPQRRFEFVLGIDADDDPTAARHIGTQVLTALEFVLDEPAPAARVEEVGDSNIVLKFLGWIDQSQTDWYKARSRAIPAVKDALEEAGFALPEPIYRLRFDAGVPAVLNEPGHEPGGMGEKPAPSARSATGMPKPGGPADHVRPDDEIAQMVRRERQESPESARDLLDPGRPVE